MPVIGARQYIPKVETLNAGNVQQELAKTNFGTQLSAKEAKWLNDVFAKFGADPGVKDSLARLMQGVKINDGNKATVATTLAALQGGAPAVVPGQKQLPVALDLAHLGVKDANDALNPGKIKDFVKAQSGLSAEQIAKHMKKPSDAFRGVVEIDPKNILPAPLGDMLAGSISIETHTNQYQTKAGTFGTNVLLNGTDNAQLIKALEGLRDTGILVKDMTHRAQGLWVAGPDPSTLGEAFSDDKGVKGTTHRGALDVGYDKNGKAQVVFSDWPVGYGHHLNGEYTPMVSRWSIDDMKFSGPPPSDAQKKSYYDTIRTYETLFAMTVPFTSGDSRTGFTDYHFSPMEDKKPADFKTRLELATQALSADPAVRDPAVKAMKERTFYCAEGIVACIHAGTMVPLNQASVDKGLMTQASLDRLKEMQKVFDAAGGQTKGKADEGWQALVSAKLITPEQYDSLVKQNMQHRPMALSLDGLPPLKELGAKTLNEDGLLHKDQHIGGLVQGMMATGFPREGLAKGLAARFIERASGNPALAAGVAQMLGLPAQTPLAQLAGAFGWAVGAQFQAKMLESPEMQSTMKKAMGYEAMDAPSKAKVDEMIKEYTAVVGNPRLDRAAFDAEIAKLNDKAAKTEVNFPALNWKGLITHVPPQSSRDVHLGVDGAAWEGLRPAFDILDASMGT
jgi:hypothetical protein